MTKEEYMIEKKKLKKEYDRDVVSLNTKFITANNDVKIGEIVTDHIGNVLVEKIKWEHVISDADFPVIVFYGPCYTKANKPFKSGEKRSVWGSNIK